MKSIYLFDYYECTYICLYFFFEHRSEITVSMGVITLITLDIWIDKRYSQNGKRNQYFKLFS